MDVFPGKEPSCRRHNGLQAIYISSAIQSKQIFVLTSYYFWPNIWWFEKYRTFQEPFQPSVSLSAWIVLWWSVLLRVFLSVLSKVRSKNFKKFKMFAFLVRAINRLLHKIYPTGDMVATKIHDSAHSSKKPFVHSCIPISSFVIPCSSIGRYLDSDENSWLSNLI